MKKTKEEINELIKHMLDTYYAYRKNLQKTHYQAREMVVDNYEDFEEWLYDYLPCGEKPPRTKKELYDLIINICNQYNVYAKRIIVSDLSHAAKFNIKTDFHIKATEKTLLVFDYLAGWLYPC